MNKMYNQYELSKKLTPNLLKSVNVMSVNQEGFGDFIANISTFFRNKIDSIKTVFSINGKNDTKSLTKGASYLYKEFSKQDKDVVRISKLKQDAYKSLSNVLVPWIPGVEPDLYTLVTELQIHVDSINKEAFKLLEDIDTFIAKITGDEEYRTSIVPNKDLINKTKDYSKTTTNYLTSTINGKLLHDRRELKDAIPNLSSVETIHSVLKSLITTKDVENVQKLFNLSESIGNRANVLHGMIKDKTLTISKVRLTELCTVLQEGAQIVTNAGALIRILDASIRIHLEIIKKFVVIK